jgi:hypothetical protein
MANTANSLGSALEKVNSLFENNMVGRGGGARPSLVVEILTLCTKPDNFLMAAHNRLLVKHAGSPYWGNFIRRIRWWNRLSE